MSTPSTHRERAGWLWVVMIAGIWLPVVYLLGAQWSIFPEYQYGWSVPVLSLYLTGLRLPTCPTASLPQRKGAVVVVLVFAGAIFWGMRGLQEADPLWRLASYGLVLPALAMTGSLVYLAGGYVRLRHFIFPAAFFLVAVPWPTPVETFIIQTLTRFNASMVAEILGALGVPAVAQGNVIEIASGTVGIEEACSGIRSFQAALMISLFFGEYHQLAWRRRGQLLIIGLVLAIGFNLLRTLVLVLIAARAGLPTMERWHDATGVVLLLACFFGIWWAASWMKSRKRKAAQEKPELVRGAGATSHEGETVSLPRLAVCIVIWALAVEISTEAWFRIHEKRGMNASAWAVKWPAELSSLRTNAIPARSLEQLRCDFDTSAGWTEPDGTIWQAFYLRWEPAGSFYGRAKVAMSKSHNPAICLSAAGMKLEKQLESVMVPVRPDLNLPFERFVFNDNGRTLYVFFSQTEPMVGQGQANLRMTHGDRWRAALAGSRSYGQVNFEVALLGPNSPAAALKSFAETLPRLVSTDTITPSR